MRKVVIYISYSIQDDRTNWIFETARSLAKIRNTKVIHFSLINDNFYPIIKLGLRRLFIFLKELFSFKFGLATIINWYFFDFNFPFIGSSLSKRISDKFNLFFLNFFIGGRDRIIVTCNNFNKLNELTKTIKPNGVIGDNHDIWSSEAVMNAQKNMDYIITNSDPIYKLHKKKFKNRVFKTSAGYFSTSFVKKMQQKSFYANSAKTILFSGAIMWRLNLNLVNYLVNKLSNYNFLFIGPKLYQWKPAQRYADNQGIKDWLNLNKKFAKEWHKLLKKSNIKYIEINKQEDILSLNIKASLGIIPYDINNKVFKDFNLYCHPIKIYHYFLMGLPVVSSKILSLLPYRSSYFRFAENKTDFVREIKNLISIKPVTGYRKEMEKLALSHTCEEKAIFIKNLMNKL